MTAKKARLIPAVARLDRKPGKGTRGQALARQRQIQAWKRAAEKKGESK